jgi:hypothetical protein
MLMMINLLILLTQKANCMITQTVNNSRKSQVRKPWCSIRCTDSRQLNNMCCQYLCSIVQMCLVLRSQCMSLLIGYLLTAAMCCSCCSCSVLLSLLLYMLSLHCVLLFDRRRIPRRWLLSSKQQLELYYACVNALEIQLDLEKRSQYCNICCR